MAQPRNGVECYTDPMKKFLKQHAWTVRIVALAVLLSAFAIIMVRIYASELNNTASVSNSEFVASVASSQAITAQKEREAAEKLAAERKAAEEKAAQQASNNLVASSDLHRDPTKPDVVVNKKNPLLPLSYTPSTVAVSCAGNGSITVQVQVKDDLTALCTAAEAAGVPLSASSAYRSYSYQVTVYNRWVAQSGQAQADTFSARPGYSEHQTGFAIDFSVPGGATLNNFTGTAQQQWLAAHAVEYGFIQRYTDANSAETGYVAESWHYRYIGRENAAAFVASGKLSLEGFWGVPGGDY